ncbi:RNA polymerase sigma factor CarQ [Planctomycetes bacterium Pan216]|uniref:RNA polymerase sigma factor CarQ n=1 Tax=Kolteria novifilia TaxID=2527975 RepID=A0A518B7F0_9BACT|nr:RNA polymerase sigma factor CarQ [Planctomycetes bacterium Pan216]
MTETTTAWLVEKIREGSEEAWQELISLYESRLSSFIRARLADKTAADDVLQETFLGFLRSLPHYDSSRDLESYLFTIAAHKIRDQLRKAGRHPLALLGDLRATDSQDGFEPEGRIRGASSIAASAERMAGEEVRLRDALGSLLDRWRHRGDFKRIKCVELLFLAGWANKDVAGYLEMTEQQVANYKFQVIESLARRSRPPEEEG